HPVQSLPKSIQHFEFWIPAKLVLRLINSVSRRTAKARDGITRNKGGALEKNGPGDDFAQKTGEIREPEGGAPSDVWQPFRIAQGVKKLTLRDVALTAKIEYLSLRSRRTGRENRAPCDIRRVHDVYKIIARA